MKFVIIGLGYWGKNYYRILSNNENVDLVAIVDPTPSIQLEEQIQIFSSLKELQNSKISIDAAVVCTPTDTHFEITKKLLEMGLHVLVEKPLATKSSEAEELINLANKKELTLLVDHTFLYNSAVNFAIKKIKEGEIGNLLHINFERTNLGPIRNDVSCLWDLTTHDISILNAITKLDPVRISASSFNVHDSEIYDMVNISLKYHDSLFVTIFSSWLHPEKTRKIKFVGDKKMIVFDDLNYNEPIKIYDKKFDQIYDKGIESIGNNSFFSFSIGDVVAPYVKNVEPLQQVINDFISNIKEGKATPSLNDLNNTLRTVTLLEAIDNEID
jgi:predicted dehydrogenase